MSTRIDSSDLTHLAICSCGWRSVLTLSKLEALTAAVRHEHIAHPGSNTARDRLRRHTGRHRHNGATGPRTTTGRFQKA